MFNRRFLRVKVLQGLYAYFQSGSTEVGKALNELHLSIERTYELYLYILNLPVEISNYIEVNFPNSEAKTGRVTNFKRYQGNSIIREFQSASLFQKQIETRKIGWPDQNELIGKVFKELRDREEFIEFLKSKENDFLSDQQFLSKFYKDFLMHFEFLSHAFQERSIFWDEENYGYAVFLANSAIKKLGPKKSIDEFIKLPYESDDDKKFVETLFKKTISESEALEKRIMSKTKNWDSDRIAMMDMLLMKMAVSEISQFKMIPVKVSMNEYIDISKAFSSPRSAQFINGVVDKVVAEMKEQKKFKKTGRGLIE